MKDSGIPWIGAVPAHWNIVRTKNVFEIGKELVGSSSSSTQLLSLTTKGIKQVEIGSTSGKVPDSYDTYQRVHPNNMVFCLFDLDCSAVFSGVSQYEGMISPAYKVATLRSGFYPKFYGYWFDYIFDGRKYKYLSKNIRYSLTYDEFAALGIVAPKYEEQQAIADFLDKKCDEIDKMIAIQEKFIEELKAYKQSVITETVCRGLNPNVPMKDSGSLWIGSIPTHWELTRIGDIGEYKKGPFGSAITLDMFVPKGDKTIKVYEQQNAIRKDWRLGYYYIDESYFNTHLKGFEVLPNDLIVSCAGTIGEVYQLPADIERGIINQALMRMRISKSINLSYFLYIFDLILKGEAERSSNGTAIKNIPPFSVFKKILFPLPPLFEQQEIANYLDKKCSEIDKLISIKQQKIEELKDYRKSLIYEYVTGKKQVV